MPGEFSIKKFLRNNHFIFIFLTILVLITYLIFINYMYNIQLKEIDNIFQINFQFLQKYIDSCVEKTLIISGLPEEDYPVMLSLDRNINSLLVLNRDGEVMNSYPHPNLKGISLRNKSIFQKVLKTGTTELEVMPYNFKEKGIALSVAYPRGKRIFIVTFHFESVIKNITDDSPLFVSSDGRGNIILSNNSRSLNTSSYLHVEQKNIFPYEAVYITSKKLNALPTKVYLIYDIENLLIKAGFLGLLVIGFIVLIIVVVMYLNRNFRQVIVDMHLLERKSQELVDTINLDREGLLDYSSTYTAIGLAGEKLKSEMPNSREMRYAFHSYRELVYRLLKLIEMSSRQNEEIASMNEELSCSYEQINNYQQKIISIIELLSSMDPNTSLDDFMEDILEHAITLIPAADAGSAGIRQGEYFRFLAQSGYSSLLKKVKFPRNILLSCDEPVIFENVTEGFDYQKPEKFRNLFNKVNPDKIRSTLAVGLKTRKIIGNIFIDSLSDENKFTAEDKKIMEAIAKISSLFIYLKLSLKELDDTYIGIIRALAEAVELKDVYTKGHSDRIARYCLKLAESMGLSRERKRVLKEAALLHDIGKIGVSDKILNKPGRLTKEEFEQIKMHTVFGGKILQNVNNLQEIARIVRHHHERWDGTGYPDGLKGEEIPLESRIIAIFDAFDTILTVRSYKQAMPFDYAIKEIMENAGTQFDPELVKHFLQVVSEDWVLAV